MVRRIIQQSALPKAILARDSNISRAALNSWIAGVREPQTNSLLHLATGLEKRAEILQNLASELRQAAEDEQRTS